jgi:hypothetical protein
MYLLNPLIFNATSIEIDLGDLGAVTLTTEQLITLLPGMYKMYKTHLLYMVYTY